VTDENAYAELLRWVERHEERHAEHDERLTEVERRQDVLYAGLAIARWFIAIAVPVFAVVLSLWKG
jgi:hypothetical protein